MKRPRDLARRFLALADRDIKVFQRLADSADIDDAAVGFHAQQAVEKCLKAVLALHEVPVRRTHNLDELVDLLRDGRHAVPPNVEVLDLLNPYAVILRYDFVEFTDLDRQQAREIVEGVRRWAEDQVRTVS